MNPGPTRDGWVYVTLAACVIAATLWAVLIMLGAVG